MGLTHLDAGVIIGLLDANDAHHNSARATITQAFNDGDQLAMAASALAECLVAPARQGETSIQTVKDVLRRLPVAIINLDIGIATQAAQLRSRHHRLRLADALVIATAAESHVDQLVTTDHRWPTQKAMKADFKITQI